MDIRSEIINRKPAPGYKFIYRYYDEDGSYIGQTKKTLKQRAGKDGKAYLTNNSKWSSAIIEKGIDHFQVEILAECLESDADRLEKEYIKKYNSRKSGYNSTFGGNCYNPDWVEDSPPQLATNSEISIYERSLRMICFNDFYSEVDSPFDFDNIERIVGLTQSRDGYNIIMDGKTTGFYVKALPDYIMSKYFNLPISDSYSWNVIYIKETSRCFLALFNPATQDIITPYANKEQNALDILYSYPSYIFKEGEGLVKQTIPDLDILYDYIIHDKISYKKLIKLLDSINK